MIGTLVEGSLHYMATRKKHPIHAVIPNMQLPLNPSRKKSPVAMLPLEALMHKII